MSRPTPHPDDHRLQRALAHPMRVEILRLLDQGVTGPTDVAARTNMPLSTCSYHFNVLAELGLIVRERTIRRRGTVQTLWAPNRPDAEVLEIDVNVPGDLRLDDNGAAALRHLVHEFERSVSALQEHHAGLHATKLQMREHSSSSRSAEV